MTKRSPFRYFKASLEIIRLAVMLYIRFSLRNVENLLHECGVDVSHEAVWFWLHRFGPTFASEIRSRRIAGMKSSRWRWHLDKIFVKINGERHNLWRDVDHKGEALRDIGAGRRQETGHWLNNRAENSHLPFRRRERALLRFRRMRNMQKFAAVHASVSNLFISERSLYSRSHFKQSRAAALAEWRGLCVA